MGHELTLALSPDAPRQIRRSLDRYIGLLQQSLLDDLVLVSSELVSNAVQHSGRPKGDPIEYRLTIFPETILVEVADRGVGTDQLRPTTGTPSSGLGLVELLSDRWAGSAHTDTFNVWLEIDIEATLIRRKQR